LTCIRPHACAAGEVVFSIHPPATPPKTTHEAQGHSALDRVNAVCRPPGYPRHRAVNEIRSYGFLIFTTKRPTPIFPEHHLAGVNEVVGRRPARSRYCPDWHRCRSRLFPRRILCLLWNHRVFFGNSAWRITWGEFFRNKSPQRGAADQPIVGSSPKKCSER
jgi:hypothetical protein